MDITSVIAATSVYMHQGQVQQSVDIAMTKKVMDTQEAAAVNLIQMISETNPPSFGHKLDIKV